MRLSLTKGAGTGDPNSIAHELEDGTTLVWTLGEDAPEGALLSADVDLADGPWIMRLDRIDFVPGGIAYRHTHPGPGDPLPAVREDHHRLRGRGAHVRPR